MSVTTLPDEILAEIFEHCVDGDTKEPGGEGLGLNPRILALVSRRWYRIALATGSLWHTILLTDEQSFYWRLKRNSGLRTPSSLQGVRTHSAMQVCTNAADLKSALRRTRETKLNITIGFQGLLPRDNYSQLYKMLFNDRIAPRITHLVLEQFSVSIMNTSLFEYMTASVHLLSNLVCLTTGAFYQQRLTPEGKTMLQLVLESAINLECIYLIDGHVQKCLKADVWQDASYRLTIRNLRQLRIRSGELLDEMFRNDIPIPDLIIEDAAQVERAEERKMWNVYTSPWPKSSTREMTLTRVTRLHLILDDISFLSRLTFPVLEDLRLTQPPGSYGPATAGDIGPLSIPDFFMDLPKLRTLRITARHFAPLNRFNLPRLESFHMTSTHLIKGKIEADFSQLFSLPAVAMKPPVEGSEATITGTPAICLFQSITTLYINANVSGRLLVQAMRGFPLLEVLRLVPGKKIARHLVTRLTIRSLKKSQTGTLCPDLKVLELDLQAFLEWDQASEQLVRVGTYAPDGLPSALEKFVASRKNAGRPLERCTVITDRDRWEYV